ncbi:hypothetical protein CWR53_12375 [Pseudomonas sp. SGAir0191]|uniref:hypothetical protein n=1 Tax=Pseudomonas sp. SGAir0191 TaxID=2217867 RepID=UPI000C2BF145|nr:hypothetical protein [Pseudomonas sp. SGAir0191]AUA33334.1 hypothetical protein CWR53_12375 [Pseudomonas sp. SGAir0191]
MRSFFNFKAYSVVTLAALVSACASPFSEPEIKPAHLKVYDSLTKRVLVVEAIDDTYVGASGVYDIQPGAHEIKVNISGAKELPKGRGCSRTLKHHRFQSEQVYAVVESYWDGVPSVVLKGARGEIFAHEDISDCII